MPVLTGKREEVIDFYDKHPNASLVEAAQAVGLSRERVRQLRKSEGMPSTVKPRYCRCGTQLQASSPRQTHCSEACKADKAAERHAKVSVISQCENCGVDIERNIKEKAWFMEHYNANYGRFCSNQCWGQVMGKAFGWQTPYQRDKGVPQGKQQPTTLPVAEEE